eukprot:366403-Chlamydomonas_euryale.AAC.5
MNDAGTQVSPRDDGGGLVDGWSTLPASPAQLAAAHFAAAAAAADKVPVQYPGPAEGGDGWRSGEEWRGGRPGAEMLTKMFPGGGAGGGAATTTAPPPHAAAAAAIGALFESLGQRAHLTAPAAAPGAAWGAGYGFHTAATPSSPSAFIQALSGPASSWGVLHLAYQVWAAQKVQGGCGAGSIPGVGILGVGCQKARGGGAGSRGRGGGPWDPLIPELSPKPTPESTREPTL